MKEENIDLQELALRIKFKLMEGELILSHWNGELENLYKIGENHSFTVKINVCLYYRFKTQLIDTLYSTIQSDLAHSLVEKVKNRKPKDISELYMLLSEYQDNIKLLNRINRIGS